MSALGSAVRHAVSAPPRRRPGDVPFVTSFAVSRPGGRRSSAGGWEEEPVPPGATQEVRVDHLQVTRHLGGSGEDATWTGEQVEKG